MASAADFANLRRRFDVATSAIAAEIRDLKEKIQAGGMTPAEEAAAFGSLDEVATQLEKMGKPEEPLPEAPEEPAPADPGTEGPGTEQPGDEGKEIV